MPLAPTGSFASRQETKTLSLNVGQSYDFNSLNINDFVVCPQIAEFYQYYRITSVQLRFKPSFDTYVAGGSAGTGVLPYLYFLYDKSGSIGLPTVPQFLEMGAKPTRFDDKTIIRKWKPSVRSASADAIALTSQFKTSPWIPTYSDNGLVLNDVPHLGACWVITKSSPSDASKYDVDITITMQFRKPRVAPPPA